MNRPKDLPEFDNPPVVETVLSVQFENLTKMHAAHFGLFWDEIRDRFPNTEERAKVDPVIEVFPSALDRRFGIKLESSDRPPMPRVLFSSADGNSLVQVQTDRLIRNWRKVSDEDTYQRYEEVREAFQLDFDQFAQFTDRNELGAISVNQCEITYVNHISAGSGGWSKLGEIDKVFNCVRLSNTGCPGIPEEGTFNLQFRILDDEGQPVGRLHVEAQPGARAADGAPLYRFSLTARGLIGAGLQFFDVGRDWIVRSFAALTTAEMHAVWKRRI